MRVSVRLTAAASALVVSNLGAQAQPSFLVPADQFFGSSGLMGRYLLSGCYGLVPRAPWICGEMTVETGIETATGLGATRYAFGRFTSSPETGYQLGGFYSAIEGRIQRTTLPAGTYTREEITLTRNRFSGSFANEGVWRNGQREGDPGRYETFIPTRSYTSFTLQYGPCGPVIPCRTEETLYFTSVTNITAVPEPSTYGLLGTGLLTLGGIAARRRKRAET